MVEKSIEEINNKIKDGSVNVVTAEEMVDIVSELGTEGAAQEVDVVTTGTFGAMCSSGAFLNFGHAEPPIKFQKIWLNDVEAYAGLAAVDAYIGSTQLSETAGMEYGGAHVIEDLISGKPIDVHAKSYGTDCYPLKVLDTTLNINDLNQTTMVNPRNGFQKYNVATNSTNRTLHTYMGTLLPNHGNITYSGSGVLSPLSNDPNYETIGTGTRIFIGGAQGYVVGEGSQHNPEVNFGTLMVQGNLKDMSPDYVRGASFYGYGTSLYMGIGVPIPVLNERIAENTAVRDEDIITNILDYGVQSRDRPKLREVSYAELKSGYVDLNGREVPTSPLSSFKTARLIAEECKDWIKNGEFFVTEPVHRLPNKGVFKPMKQTMKKPLVGEIMARNVVTIQQDSSFHEAAKKIMESTFDHLPVVSEDSKLVGIVTAWDISKAVAQEKYHIVKDFMTKDVVTATTEETIDIAAHHIDQKEVSALPVVDDERRVVGIITSNDISKLLASE
jgi:uncharacterized protein (DUF39 family)/CBS domain-containing protein